MTKEEKIIATAFTGKMFIDGSEMGSLYEYMGKKIGAPDKIYAKYTESAIAYAFNIIKSPFEGATEYVRIDKIKAELERRISRCEKKHPPLMSDKDFTDEENEIYCEERAYREILSFIDSLQDEPIVKDSKVSEEIDQNFTKSSDDDLEKAAEEYTDGINWAKENYITPYIRLSFKAGANWLAEQRDKLNVVNPIRLDEDTLKHIQELAYESGKADMKEEFEKNRLDACDKITKEEYDLETALVDKYIKKYKRLPMFVDAINYGIELQKERDHDACLSCEKSRDVVFHNGMKYAIEQMKKEAVEGVVCKQRDSSQATWIELAPNSLPAFDDCELVKCIILKDENGDSCTRS